MKDFIGKSFKISISGKCSGIALFMARMFLFSIFGLDRTTTSCAARNFHQVSRSRFSRINLVFLVYVCDFTTLKLQTMGIPFEYNQAIELLFLYWNQPNLSIALAEVNPHRNNVSALLRNCKSPADVQRLYQVRARTSRRHWKALLDLHVSRPLVMCGPNYQRQVPGEEFLQKYPRILVQNVKLCPCSA